MTLLDRLKAVFGGGAENGKAAAISCDDALTLVQEFLDGELSDVSEAEVAAHFDACQRCYPHLHLEQCFRRAVVRAAGEEPAPAALKARLRELIAEARKEG